MRGCGASAASVPGTNLVGTDRLFPAVSSGGGLPPLPPPGFGFFPGVPPGAADPFPLNPNNPINTAAAKTLGWNCFNVFMITLLCVTIDIDSVITSFILFRIGPVLSLSVDEGFKGANFNITQSEFIKSEYLINNNHVSYESCTH
jgi:hypothetical protein